MTPRPRTPRRAIDAAQVPPRATDARRPPAPYALIVVVILAAAAVVRIRGGMNSLWLDEIWSIDIAATMSGVSDVFALHHEINHHINTVWLYLLGYGASPLEYRGLSIAAGIASVAAGGYAVRRHGRPTIVFALVLIGGSYELTLFASEARGYSLMVLCALLAYATLASELRNPRWQSAAAYGLCCVIGLLAHAMFASVIGAGAAWAMWHWHRAEGSAMQRLLAAAKSQATPVLCVVTFYLGDLRHVVPGGGAPAASLAAVYMGSFSWALGIPATEAWGLVAFLAVAGLAVFVANARRAFVITEWPFWLAAVAVMPVALILIRGSDLVYTRHFIVGITVVLLLSAVALGVIWERGGKGRAACIIACSSFMLVNARHTSELFHRGRGQYAEAIAYMSRHSGRDVIVGGDHDYRVRPVVQYYFDASGVSGKYVESPWSSPPQWIIAHAEPVGPPIPPGLDVADPAGHRYALDRIFPSAPLSGMHWFLYKHVPRGVAIGTK